VLSLNAYRLLVHDKRQPISASFALYPEDRGLAG